jgi:hypothetical protein
MSLDSKRWVWIGVDLGQRRDFSAIAVLERVWEQSTTNEFLTGSNGQWSFRVRLLERIRLQTAYTDVGQRVKQISNLPLIAMNRTVVVDGTRVGPPVIEMMRHSGMTCSVNPVIITGGARPSIGLVGGYESVPRPVLLTGLQVLMQQGCLRVAAGCWELQGLKLVGPGRKDHDDLALALALAVWKGAGGADGWVRRNRFRTLADRRACSSPRFLRARRRCLPVTAGGSFRSLASGRQRAGP